MSVVSNPTPYALIEIMDQFTELFQVAQGFPPSKAYIPPQAKGYNIMLIQEMLESGIIQQAAVLMLHKFVGKKDGLWRLCGDYRELKKYIVKDKFSIPLVKELIDELVGAQIFTKIDLSAKYHQLRMPNEDVYK